MSLLSVVNDVCAVVGAHQMTSVFSNINNNRTAFEMLALANEMAQRIAYETREWTRLYASVPYTGTGVIDAWQLPADYKRMLLTSNVWRGSNVQTPLRFISDFETWTRRRAANYVDLPGEWIIYGGDIHIMPVLAPGEIGTFNYLHRNCIMPSGNPTLKADVFQNDIDQYYLDERLLKLGMIWQWKANKGSPYAEDMATFMDALSRAAGADKPSPIIIDRVPLSAARPSYPYPTPTSADWSWPLG